MAYLVKFTVRAARDLEILYEEKSATESVAAARWYNGLEEAVYTLAEYPRRCSVTPENGKLRHLLYGDKPHVYRVIYRVLEKQQIIEVLHIRHGVRQKFRPTDFG